MKQISLSLLLCTAIASSLFCQQNKDALIKEVEEKLKTNKATISQILTDKKYDPIDDDERLKGSIREQAIRNRFIISKPEKATTPFEQLFSYVMTLQTR